MHILYISQYFPPEIGAASARAFELSRRWVESGHHVTVLTGLPNYPTGSPDPVRHGSKSLLTRRETVEGVRVIRTWLLSIGERRVRDRILSYASFWLTSTLRVISLSRPDVVVASSPPLTVGLTGWWVSLIKKTPFILDVRDLWPESITDLGAVASQSTIVHILDRISRFLYKTADGVVVISNAMREALADGKGVSLVTMATIPNGVETESFIPRDRSEATRSELGLSGKILVSFIGTIGLAQDIDVIIQSASRLASGPNPIHFLFVGEGPMKRHAMEAVARVELSNVSFLAGQKRDKIPALIAASDICLVTLRKAGVNDGAIPVRMLEFMSCGRPVVLCADGQASRILKTAEAGVVVEQGDDSALAAAIVRLASDVGLRRKMGANGRRYILDNFSREQTAIRYLEVLEEVSSNYVKVKGKRQ